MPTVTPLRHSNRFWRLCLITGAVAALLIAGFLLTRATRWQSTAILVTPIQAPSSGADLLGASSARKNLARIQGVAESYKVLSKAAAANGTDAKALDRDLSFQIDEDFSQLTFFMRSTDKQRSLKLLTDILRETSATYNEVVAVSTNTLVASLEQRQKEIQNRLKENELLRSKLMEGSTGSSDERAGQGVLEQKRITESRIKEVESQLNELKSKELKALEAEEASMASTNRIFEGKTLLEIRAEAQFAAEKFAPGAVEYQQTHRTLAIAEGLIKGAISARRDAINSFATPGLKDLSGTLSGLKIAYAGLKDASKSYAGGRTEMSALTLQIEGDMAALNALRIGIEDARSKSVAASVGWATLQDPKIDEEPVKRPILELSIVAFLLGAGLAAVIQIFWPRKEAAKPA